MAHSQPLHDDTRKRVWFEHGCLVQENTQPNRKQVLEQVKDRRNHPESMRKLDFGVVALTIPQLDFQRLCKLNPDLVCPDGHTQTAAWRKFMASSMSEPYRNYPGRNVFRGK